MNFDAMAESFYSSNDPQFYVDHEETEEEREERRNDLLDYLADDIAIWNETIQDSYNYYCLNFKNLSYEQFKEEMKIRGAL